MILKDWIRGKPETRQAGYTDGIIELLLERAGSNVSEPRARDLAVVEVAAGLVGRAFSNATLTGATPAVEAALTPSVLSQIGRALMRAGDDLWLIEVEGGQIVLRQAHSWDVQGGIRDWTYDGNIGTPSGAACLQSLSC